MLPSDTPGSDSGLSQQPRPAQGAPAAAGAAGPPRGFKRTRFKRTRFKRIGALAGGTLTSAARRWRRALPAVAVAGTETPGAPLAAPGAAPAAGGTAPPAAGTAPAAGGTAPPAPRVQAAEIAGALLARLTVLPALLILAWLIPGLPLLLAGDFLPVTMLLISVPLAVALAVYGLRVVPAGWPRLLSGGRTADPAWATWFGLLATVAVVAGLTAWQLTEGSQALIVLRDPGTYLQAGYWIAQHGFLPIPEMAKSFGGAHAGLEFTSTGFLARGGALYPAATPGLPMLLAGSFWVHGVTGATAAGPVIGGLAAFTFAGLVARLTGPQWAPAGALVLGLCLPQQYIGRTTLSESALQIMLFGGLCLLADSVALRGFGAAAARRAGVAILGARPSAAPSLGGGVAVTPDGTAVLPVPLDARGRRASRLAAARRAIAPSRFGPWLTPQRTLAALAGLSLGFGLLISLDALVYLLAVIPFCCVLFMGHRAQATPFLVGWLLGVCYGLLGCFLLDRPFLDLVAEIVALSGLAAVWLVALCVLVMQLARIGRVRSLIPAWLRRRPWRWLPEAGAVLAVAALIGFAVRPYLQTVHGHPSLAEYHFIEALQRAQGLPADPARVYAEQTLYWTIWYIGLPTVLLAGFGLALVLRGCLRALLTWRDPAGVWRGWGLPLAVICAASAVSLWAPDIYPDQPWASRRLIVTVIPGLIICALQAASWLARRARDRGARSVTAAVAGLFCVAAMLVPTVSTTFGLGLRHSGKSGGLEPVAQGLALTRTGAGEIGAVADLCAQLPGNASVVILGRPAGSEFTQLVRGMCGVPAAWMPGEPTAAVDSVIGSISAAGRRPLLLAPSQRQLAAFGGSPVKVLDLVTAQDPHELTQLPTTLERAHYQLWLTAPGSAGAGA